MSVSPGKEDNLSVKMHSTGVVNSLIFFGGGGIFFIYVRVEDRRREGEGHKLVER